MRPIRWLHISDIHMRPRDEWSQNVVLLAMHEDIERQRADSAIDFILVSGDLAYSGKAEEYVLVGQFFDDLATASGVQKDRIFCIPGNHDIDRDRQKLCFRGARIAFRDPSTTDSFLASPIADDFVTLLERQESYRSFQSAYFGDQERIPTNDGLGYVTRLIIDGVRLAILGFDSAWLADGGVEDHLNLLLGERQVLNTIRAVRDGDDPPHIIAAMAHHPLHLLQDFDRRNVQTRIEGFCHFLHCGHLHNPEARPTGNSPLGCLTLAAGASFETRHTQNSYCAVTLDLLRGLRTLTINHYNATEGVFSVASTHDYRIEVVPTSRCDVGELAATIAARTETPWPHYVAALLLASKSELPVPVFDGHTFASFEVIEAKRQYLERFCNAKPFDGIIDCSEHYKDLSRFEKVFLSELELNISKSYEVKNFRFIPGKLTEDIPVFVKEHSGSEPPDIFVDVRHQEITKLQALGYSQVLYSLIATFCREYLGPSLKKWSPRFFGDGALNLELLAKRRSELWILLKDDIGVVRKSGRRHVVRSSDVRIVNIGGGPGQLEPQPQSGKPYPRILYIIDEQLVTELSGYYIRMPDSAFIAYGDLLSECESRGIVWAGNKILYVVSDTISAAFQYEIRLDEVVAADVNGEIRAEGALPLDRPLQEMYEVYRLRVLGQWFDGIRFYAAASSPRRSRRTWAGLR